MRPSTIAPPDAPPAATAVAAAPPRRRFLRPPSGATLLGLVLALIVWLLELRPLIDNSFLIHLETGHWILDHRAIPSSDIFSFSASGVPWVVQSWLASVVYAAIDQTVGPFGIQVLRAATCALITFLVYLLALRLVGDRTRATLLAFAATGMSITVWAERPLLQGVLAMVVLIWVVEMPDSFVGRHPVAVVPPLMWLWANFHGSFALGFAYLGLHLAGRCLDGARPTEGRERTLLMATVIALAACLVNPLGLTLLTFPVELLSRGDTLAHIREWRSPDFHSVMGMLFALWIATFVLVVARACAVPERRPDRRPFLHWVVLALFVVLGITGFAQAAGGKHFDYSGYPVKAMETAEQQGLLGRRLLTSDAWAAYVIHTYWPRQQVFLDDRYDMFPTALAEDYFDLGDGKANWREILDRHDIEVIVWDEDKPLASLLDLDTAHWTRIHRHADEPKPKAEVGTDDTESETRAGAWVRRPSPSSP